MKKLIGDRLEEVFEIWTEGWSFLITDDLISFYSFFTVIFAECAYLWAFYESAVAIPFTVILLGYVVNVIVTAWFKTMHEGERKEVIFTILYVAVFAVLCIIGCFFDILLSITLTVIPFAITAVWIQVREFQDSTWVGFKSKIINILNKLFANKVFWVFSQFIVIGGPFIAFVVCLAQIPTLAVALKIIIPIGYAVCMPFIAFLEDSTSALDILELAYVVTWSKEYEDSVKNMLRMTKNKEDESD